MCLPAFELSALSCFQNEENGSIHSVAMCHVGASFVSLALTFFQKSERTHAAAPPFQIEPATLGFDLVLGANLEPTASIMLQLFK